MKKRLWRLISVLLIFTIGFAGPLGNIAFALADPLDTFDFDLGTNPYIEFKNTSGSSIDVNPTGKINFTIQGTSLDEAILDSTNSGTIVLLSHLLFSSSTPTPVKWLMFLKPKGPI